MSRLDWFRAAKFGLFIHFDHASQQGVEISWPLLGLREALQGPGSEPGPTTNVAGYHATAATFDPVSWNPEALAKQAADAGMQYAVFTTKHHSGWTSWPSEVGPFTIASSPYGQRGGDLVREFVTAFRNAGLRIGLYFSLPDWSHPDYPAWTDEMQPYPYEDYPRPSAELWARFRDVIKGELTELLTGYGQIDLLWFDGQWERTAEEWGSKDLEAHIRSIAPDVVINDRLPEAGDFATPEQIVPGQPPADVWEACLTMSDTWAYGATDHNYKSVLELIRTLVETVSLGGNLLLNVGPKGDGAIPEQETERLAGLAEWMAAHAESIHGAEQGLEPWQYYGPATRRDNLLYLHLTGWPEEFVTVRGIHVGRVRSGTILSTGEQLDFHAMLHAGERDADPVGNLVVEVPADRPVGPAQVIRLEFDGPVPVPGAAQEQ